MGDFEPDKGGRQATHLILSRRGPYARSLTGASVPLLPSVRPLPGASICEGPLATIIAAVTPGDPPVASWSPRDPSIPYYSVEDVDYLDPDISEGIFLDRGGLLVDDYPTGFRLRREPALEDDPDSVITVPMHHNARILRVADTRMRSENLFNLYPYYFFIEDSERNERWPPVPIQLKDVPGYARNPCQAIIDCCEDPADPSIVRPTWFFRGIQGGEVYRSYITSLGTRHVFMLESVYSPWTPAEIDADSSVLNRPDRPGFDERDPAFMERQRGNLLKLGGDSSSWQSPPSLIPLNDPGTWQEYITIVAYEHHAYNLAWALVEGETNLYRHSIFENHVFVQNHEVDHVDLVMRNLTFPFYWVGGEPPQFRYDSDRSERTQMIPFAFKGPTLRMHLYKPRMRWWPYDAVDDIGGGQGYWRVEIPLIDFYDPLEAFEYLLSMVYAEDGSPMATYDSGYVDISDSPPATFSDLIDLAIDAANDGSSFNISRQPDDEGNAILHITYGSGSVVAGDTLDFYFVYTTEDEDFDIVDLFDVEEYELPLIETPKGWCFDAEDEVASVVIEGPDDWVLEGFGYKFRPGFSRGIKYLDVWGKEMPPEWFDGANREVGDGIGPYFDELKVARIRLPITIPPGMWAIGFSWEYSGSHDPWPQVHSSFQVEHVFIPDNGPRCIPWMTPTGGSDCALGSLPPLD